MTLKRLKSFFSDKVFDIALFISVLFHLLLFLELPQIRPRADKVPKLIYKFSSKEHKVKETAVPQYTPLRPKPKNNMALKKERFKKTGVGKRFIPKPKARQKLSATVIEKMKKADLQSPEKIDEELFRKMIEIQEVPADPKVRAYYLNYYDKIRNKIKHYAFKSYRRSMPSGDVFITFTLDYKGRLLSAAVIKEKSSAPYELCQLALNSLTRAAPFGAFPPELVHEKLKFNVVISFKRR